MFVYVVNHRFMVRDKLCVDFVLLKLTCLRKIDRKGGFNTKRCILNGIYDFRLPIWNNVSQQGMYGLCVKGTHRMKALICFIP